MDFNTALQLFDISEKIFSSMDRQAIMNKFLEIKVSKDFDDEELLDLNEAYMILTDKKIESESSHKEEEEKSKTGVGIEINFKELKHLDEEHSCIVKIKNKKIPFTRLGIKASNLLKAEDVGNYEIISHECLNTSCEIGGVFHNGQPFLVEFR